MNARITAIGIVSALTSIVSTFAQIIVVNGMVDNGDKLDLRMELIKNLTRTQTFSDEYPVLK
jgi:hypothetical protein